MTTIIDISELKSVIDRAIKEDIEQFGKPSIVYYFHHMVNQLNSIDDPNTWLHEQKSLKAQGLSMKPVNKEIEFNGIIWNCIIWVFRPFKKDGITFNEKKYNKLTNYNFDPLSMAIGDNISGFCYLELIDPKQNNL